MTFRIKSYLPMILLLTFAIVLTACGTSASKNTDALRTNDSPAEQEQVELLVSAAASLQDALQEIQTMYEAHHEQIKLTFNYGGSGALQQQIEQGAPADLFISAASKHIQALVDKQLIDEQQQRDLLANELVVVVPADSKLPLHTIEDLRSAALDKLAVGIPETVPAGAYAKQALMKHQLWEPLASKIVQAKDVRQVLQYAETGNVGAGFVYKTDALTSDKVKIAFAIDPADHDAIIYPIGIVKATKHMKETEELYDFLQSPEVMDVFAKYGFSAPPAL